MNEEQKMKAREWLQAAPNLGKLFWRMSRDARVSTRSKVLFGAVAVYLIVPFDVIPDWIPGLGQLDDILIVVMALDVMLNQVPADVIEEHWDGSEQTLHSIRSGVRTVASFVPRRVRRIFSQPGDLQ